MTAPKVKCLEENGDRLCSRVVRVEEPSGQSDKVSYVCKYWRERSEMLLIVIEVLDLKLRLSSDWSTQTEIWISGFSTKSLK